VQVEIPTGLSLRCTQNAVCPASACLGPAAALKASLVVVKLRTGGVREKLRSDREFRESSLTDRHTSRDFRESSLTDRHTSRDFRESSLTDRHTSRDFRESSLTDRHTSCDFRESSPTDRHTSRQYAHDFLPKMFTFSVQTLTVRTTALHLAPLHSWECRTVSSFRTASSFRHVTTADSEQ